jgi:type I restriction enzyme S subunit
VFPKNTLFFTIAANIGDVVIVPYSVACPDSLIAINTRTHIDKYWLIQALKYRKKEFELLATSNAQLNINLEKLNPYLLPVPSQEEQTAIANALTDVDSLIVSLETLIAKKSAIKTAAMQQLLTGKKRLPGFTKQSSELDNASETAQVAQRLGYKQSVLGEIPENWEVTPLEAMVGFNNGCAHENHIKEYGNYTVVNSKFVSTEGRIAKYSGQCLCPVYKNNILMVMSDVPNGKAIAKCFLVDEDDKYTLNQRICAIDPKEMDSKYLFLILSRNSFYLQFDDGAKQTNLRRQDVLDCPIPVPSIKEQIAISSALFDMKTELDALQQRLSKTKKIKQGMMQELLTGKTRLV